MRDIAEGEKKQEIKLVGDGFGLIAIKTSYYYIFKKLFSEYIPDGLPAPSTPSRLVIKNIKACCEEGPVFASCST